ncbi:MAG: DUF1778 domain-containing protein [Polaromonas sp.]
MPRIAVKENSRLALRVSPADKAKLMRAVALERTDMTDFILRNALRAADEIIDHAERMVLSARDTRLWLDLLDNPPQANARLMAAAKALPDA